MNLSCNHKMELVNSGEYYVWKEDILFVERRENYECENCGLVEIFEMEVEDETVEDENHFPLDF